MIAYVRVIDGQIVAGRNSSWSCPTTLSIEPLEVGVFTPGMMQPVATLQAGEVGYIATGLKNVRDCRVGDTVTDAREPADRAAARLSARPSRWSLPASIRWTTRTIPRCATSLEKLQLNDASLVFQPESSVALNLGFRCGFLGLLHMEIVQERLEREYDLDLLATAPSVEYQVLRTNGEMMVVDNPADLPDADRDRRDPRALDAHQHVHAQASTSAPLMDLATTRRGEFDKMEYLDERRVLLDYLISRWPRSWWTFTTSSSRARAAMPRWTMPFTAIAPATWSRWTSW